MAALRRWLLVFPTAGFAAGIAGIVVGGRAARTTDPKTENPPALAISAGRVDLPDGGSEIAAFEIDRVEVSAAEYEACVRAGACVLYGSVSSFSGPEAYSGKSAGCTGGRVDDTNERINCVDWFNANAYCTWAGKRLPTREEWWKAIGARKADQRGDVHRSEIGGSAILSEWTSTPVSLENGALWETLRTIGTLRGPTSPYRAGEAWLEWRALTQRSVDLGFRCAR